MNGHPGDYTGVFLRVFELVASVVAPNAIRRNIRLNQSDCVFDTQEIVGGVEPRKDSARRRNLIGVHVHGLDVHYVREFGVGQTARAGFSESSLSLSRAY